MMPIPDPKELKEKFSNLVSRGKGSGKDKPTGGKSSGYTGNFN
jgi:hypothetical protein